jgi:hypothetical protein
MKLPIFKSSNEAVDYGFKNKNKKTVNLCLARRLRVKMLISKLAAKGGSTFREMWLCTQSQLYRECIDAITGQIIPEKVKAIFQ